MRCRICRWWRSDWRMAHSPRAVVDCGGVNSPADVSQPVAPDYSGANVRGTAALAEGPAVVFAEALGLRAANLGGCVFLGDGFARGRLVPPDFLAVGFFRTAVFFARGAFFAMAFSNTVA